MARTASVAAAGALMVAAAGCGGSSSSGSSGTTSGGSGASAKPAVNVGVVGTFTGPAATSETAPKALEAWGKSINAAGGINGQNVNIIIKDIGTTPGAGLRAVKSLISDDHVVALIDQDPSDTTWVKAAEAAGVPVMGAGGGVGLYVSNDVYPIFPSTGGQTYTLPAVAKQFGAKVAVGYAAEFTPAAQQVQLFKTFGKTIGVSFPLTVKLSSSAPDYTAFCQQLKTSGVQSYLLAFVPAVSSKITKQCVQQGVKIPQVIYASLGEDAWKTDPAYDGTVAIETYAPFFDTSVPAIKTYNDALKQYDPSLIGKWKGTSGALAAWAGAQMFAAGARKAGGSVTSASVIKGLKTMNGETLDGLIVPVNYTQASPRAQPCWFTWKIQDGDLVSQNGGKSTCAPQSVIAPVDAAIAKSVGGK